MTATLNAPTNGHPSVYERAMVLVSAGICVLPIRADGSKSPALDSWERFKEELPETKVVLMTGHGNAVGALDATAFGAYDYLLKPFDRERFGRALARARAELDRVAELEPEHPALPAEINELAEAAYRAVIAGAVDYIEDMLIALRA